MNQIYSTQCPIGYGLGASSGFQVKRLSPGYPVSSDYRHFSLRAFVAGTRQPAPAGLRYRRGGGAAGGPLSPWFAVGGRRAAGARRLARGVIRPAVLDAVGSRAEPGPAAAGAV